MEHFGGTVAQVRLSRVPWTRLEAMGHLVDWASTHQQWLARALTQPKLVAAGYPRDEWVTVQRYSELSWTAVTGLWAQLNQLLVHVLRQIPEEKLSMPCQVGIERPIPLAELIERYVAHCDDIIGQVLARD